MLAMNPDEAQAPQTASGAPWIWSIGIYAGKSPLRLAPAVAGNPVLSARDVTDVPARFVADPFMLPVNGLWHMFFEVLNDQTGRGEIGLATSPDGLSWQYRQIVLTEPFHLSYPYVFRWNHDFYMVPETLEAGAVRLYRAAPFPYRWEYAADLISGVHADPSLFYCKGRSAHERFDERSDFEYERSNFEYERFEGGHSPSQHSREHRSDRERSPGRWWLFTCPNPGQHDTLCLYSADSLTSAWTEHPLSPLITANPSFARPAGRVLLYDENPQDRADRQAGNQQESNQQKRNQHESIGHESAISRNAGSMKTNSIKTNSMGTNHVPGKLLRYTQDCFPIYGKQVRAFEITELTPTTYREREVAESPVLTPAGDGWNASGMHHVDAHQLADGSWLACVDGLKDF